jgi:hypothetical protein
MKKIAVALSFMLLSNLAQANVFCGSGIIVDLKEGGWNQDGLAIRLSGANSQGNSPTTLKAGSNGDLYVWYRLTNADMQDFNGITQSRLDAIRRSASLAFAMGATVWTFSHNNSCSDTTELSVLDW